MLRPVEAAWLAGLVDADGSIRLKKGAKNTKAKQNSLIPHVSISNTCVLTLNRVMKFLGKIKTHSKTSEKNRIKAVHSIMRNVDVYGMKQCEPLLRCIQPHLVTKNLEAQLLLRFIERRKSRGVRNKPYESVDYATHAAMSYLKKSRHLRDYMPKIEEILGQDIVRTSAKALEVAEMSTRFSQKQLNERASKLVWYRWDKSKAITRIA